MDSGQRMRCLASGVIHIHLICHHWTLTRSAWDCSLENHDDMEMFLFSDEQQQQIHLNSIEHPMQINPIPGTESLGEAFEIFKREKMTKGDWKT